MNQLNQFDSPAWKEAKTWREKHDAYLQSDHWQDLRLRCFAKANNQCEACKTNKNLEGHHLIYRDPIERGMLADIMALCGRCHVLWHDYLHRNTLTLSQFDRTSTGKKIRDILKTQGGIRKKSRKQKRHEAKLASRSGQPQQPVRKYKIATRPKIDILEDVIFEQSKAILTLQQLCSDLQARISILEHRHP